MGQDVTISAKTLYKHYENLIKECRGRLDFLEGQFKESHDKDGFEHTLFVETVTKSWHDHIDTIEKLMHNMQYGGGKET